MEGIQIAWRALHEKIAERRVVISPGVQQNLTSITKVVLLKREALVCGLHL